MHHHITMVVIFVITTHLCIFRRYTLVLTCKDDGQPPLISVSKLTIEVGDVNDNSPNFRQMSYSADVLENNYIGASVVRVTAEDVDIGENSKIVYSLSKDHDRYFSIHPDNGHVTAKSSLNREERSYFRFQVYASDCGVPSRTSTTVVEVKVLDVNDEKPKFLSDSYFFSVVESLPPGATVGKLEAFDADATPYDQFSFQLLESGSLSDAISVNRKSGVMTTSRTLDREYQEVCHMTAIARDDNNPSLSSTTAVTVRVLDVNDRRPVFDQPAGSDPAGGSGEAAIVVVSNLTPAGFTITTVWALDGDAHGNNSRVRYSIGGGDVVGLFQLDPHTGVVTLDRDLNGDADNQVWNICLIL